MSTLIAFVICSLGVWGLFYLNRNRSVRNSKALWLPVIWLLINGSRPATEWFGVRSTSGYTLQSTLDGSPLDAAVFGILIALGLIVLFQRKRMVNAYARKMTPIVLYLLYCLLSVAWAPYSGPAFKRWIKDVGDVVVVLIIVTDANPIVALQRVFSRVGFILLPFSVMMIRYTSIGREFDPQGAPTNTGVTTNKNTLGVIVFVISLGALWCVRSLLKNRNEPNRKGRLVAQGTLLVFGLMLLWMAHSSTALACFLLGSGLLLATDLRPIRSKPGLVHALCLGILLAGGITLLVGGTGAIAGVFGRQGTFSGRTDIWAALVPAQPHPLYGTGFDSFWTSPAAETFQQNLSNWYHAEQINEAHNGYIEVYMNLGWIGIGLISVVLISGYRRAVSSIRLNPSVGGLMLAYIVSGAFYSITEAGFRTMSPMWIFLLIAIISSAGIASGLWGEKGLKKTALHARSRVRVPRDVPAEPDTKGVYIT